MKHHFTFFLILLSSICYSQSSSDFLKTSPYIDEHTPDWALEMYKEEPNVTRVDQLYKTHFEKNSFQKSIHTQNYRHWRRAIEPYLLSDGTVSKALINQERKNLFEGIEKDKKVQRSSNSWTPIGPYDTYSTDADQTQVSWQANVYTIDQSLSDPDILYAGSEAGGIFKTNDKGLNWDFASFNSALRSVTSVKIHPTNPSFVLAGDGNGIYKTVDGGDNWLTVLDFGGLGVNDFSYNIDDPNDILAACNQGLYRSTDGGDNWIQILSERIWDIERKPDNSQVVYILRSNPSAIRTEMWKSTNGGQNFSLKDTGWYSSNDPNRNEGGARMTVTPADPERVYAILIGAAKADDFGYIGLYRSNNAAESWALTDPPVGGPYNNSHPNLATITNTNTYHQGYYNLGIAASHSNADHVILGFLNLWRTLDGGASFQAVGGYQGNVGWIHPDQQEIEINGPDMWLANDGGINYSTDLFNTHVSRKNGLQGSDFWGFGSGWNEDLVVGGRYHNGNTAYRPSFGEGRFLRLGGAEAATGYVQPGGESVAFFSDISAKRIPQNLSDAVENVASLSMYPSESFYASHYSELEFDPNCYGHMYIGNGNKFWKSEDNGNTFDLISSFGNDEGAPLLQFEISRVNNDVIYIYQLTSFYGATLWVTQDGGISWSQKVFPQGPSSMRAGALTIHSEDPATLWVSFAHQNNDGFKLFRTDDYGDSWENMSDEILNGASITAVFHHAGTESDLYVATNRSIYYYDGEDWSACNDGLPARFVTNRFMPFYKDNKLRVASYGNGIWETHLIKQTKPIAQATVDKRISNCSRDTFAFDDYSVVEHTSDATWSWSFSPEPAFISDPLARNPKVVFGNAGTYRVSLEVSNQFGSDIFEKDAFIQILDNACEPDIYPGQAAICFGSGNDYVQTSALDLSTDVFTITAWIKPFGIQNDYTGIVFNDGEGTGLNFTTNNQLGFHYEGQGSAAWAWSSGLFIPEDEWSYVAMVVEEDKVTLYLNGVPSERALDLDPTSFSSLKFGSYRGWGSRNYNGQIDEVAIWDRALSTEEIRTQRHITKLIEDSGLFAYYQFNESDGRVLDRVGLAHAFLTGATERTVSTVPIGGGTAYTLQGESSGLNVVEGADLNLSIVSNDSENMRTVSSLNVEPMFTDEADVFPPNKYWIANFYGNQGMNELVFLLEDVEKYYETNPSEIRLYRRIANDSEGSWEFYSVANQVIFGDKSEIHFPVFSGPDMQIIMTKAMVTGTSNIEEESMMLYPNPTRGALQVNPNGEEGRINIYNDKGQLILSRFIKMEERLGLLEGQAAGSYRYVFETKNKLRTGTIVLVK